MPGALKIPAPGVSNLAGPVRAPEDEEIADLREAPDGQLGEHDRAAQTAVVLEHDAKLVAPLQRAGFAQLPAPCRGRLHVGDDCLRHHEGSRPGEPGSPAQVDVLAEHRDLFVEAVDRVEEVGADKGATAWDGEGLLHLVVLGLVELTSLDAAHRSPEAVDTEAELEDVVGFVRVDELRPDDARVLTERLLDHSSDGITREDDVVVAEEEVRRAFDDAAYRVGARAEASVLLEAADIETRRDLSDTRGERRFARGVDDEHGEIRVVLLPQRLETGLEPGAGIV